MRGSRAQRRPVPVITEAAESPQRQLRRRQIQYATLMGLRVVCLVAAAVVVSAGVPYPLFWVLLLTVGMVALPWMAVLIANDRPPKKASRFTTRFRRGTDTAALPGAADPSAPGAPHRPPGEPRDRDDPVRPVDPYRVIEG